MRYDLTKRVIAERATMNRQIQDFINSNETEILNKVGEAIAERAVVLLDEYIKKIADVVASGLFDIPDDQPMMDVKFHATVRSIIRGEAVNIESDSKAPRIADDQIAKATEECREIIAKE